MKLTTQIAKHFREVYFGGNWTASNLKDVLANITYQQAVTQVHSFNTIVTLVYHINYYVSAITKVLEGEPLNAKDSYSFTPPSIQSQDEWLSFLDTTYKDAAHFANLVHELPDSILDKHFTDEKYGSYYRNLQGIIEHTHYHLGQIILLKKLV